MPKNEPVPASGAFDSVSPPPLPDSSEPSNIWHIAGSGLSHGPFTLEEMLGKFRSGQITGKTRIWCPGMALWKEAAAVDAFQLMTAPPPPVPEANGEISEIAGPVLIGKNGDPQVVTAYQLSQNPKAVIRSQHAGDQDPIFTVSVESNPALRIRARSGDEAEAAYKRYMGIVSTQHPVRVAA